MTSTDQIIAPAERSETAKTVEDTSLRSFLWRCLASPIAASSIAVRDTAQQMAVGIYEAAPMCEADRQIARLNAMRGAGRDWAGPGTEAPNLTSLEAAISLINRLRHLALPIPMASIGTHGNAGLFWSDARLYADIELLEDGRVGYLLHPSGADPIDDEEELPSVGLPPTIAKTLATAYLANRR